MSEAFKLLYVSLGLYLAGTFLLQPILETDVTQLIANPLSLSHSTIHIWPQIVVIKALAIIYFALSYITFMRQEIRII